MDTVVWTQDLTKRYGRTDRVRQLNLKVPEGVIYGFLGPNGAGKSTTLKMLLAWYGQQQVRLNCLDRMSTVPIDCRFYGK